jgi:hypothetical protein
MWLTFMLLAISVPKADIETQSRDVRFVPKADIARRSNCASRYCKN